MSINDLVKRGPVVSIRRVEELSPYQRNSRTHSAEQVAQIAASIREFGFTNPILVSPDGMVVAGHGRLAAARSIGLLEVPTIEVGGEWSPEQLRAYILADNQLALNAGWDDGLLADELRFLANAGFEMGLVGFSEASLASLLAEKSGGLTDPEDAPEPPAEPVSRLGDVWLLGQHRLVCGDCRDIDLMRRLTGGVAPDLANCDPPYGVSIVKCSSDGGAKPFGSVGASSRSEDPKHIKNYKGKVGGGNAPYGGWKDGKRSNGARLGREHGPAKNAIIKPGCYAPIIGDDSTDTAVASYETLKAIGARDIVMWGGNYYADKLPASRCWLVWDKEVNGNFADAELAWTNKDACVRLFRHQWSGLIKASERGERRVHPTQKPVALAEWVIETMAPECDTVIDLFAGSGSTILACQRLEKQCFAAELAPAYVDVAVERWQGFTGREATLEASGKSFAETRAERLPQVAETARRIEIPKGFIPEGEDRR